MVLFKMVITNPLHRCIYCNGREVLKVENEQVIETSFDSDNGLCCKDKQECKANIEAENNMIHFSGDNGKINNIKVVKNAETIFEMDNSKA